MKTISVCRSFVLATLLVTSLSSCNTKQEENKQTAPADPAKECIAQVTKIGYVELDSLMSQYKFCKDYTILLTKRGENISATLSNKEKALQQAVESFQRKLQEGRFTTQQEAEQEQSNLRKQEMEYMQLRERLTMQLSQEQQSYTNEMRDSIQSFLKEYNKAKGFDLILSKAGDNILLANKAMDVTNDVIAGLNKRYKPSAATKKGTK